MIIEGFLLGVIAAASLTASLFFLRFWRDTHESLFLAFSTFFLLEAVIRVTLLFFAHPNEGSPWIYGVRLAASAGILLAILRKNFVNS